jgi:hypothetical protein
MQNGQEAQVPMALALGITEWEPDTTPTTYARELIQQMQITNRLVAENIKERHEKEAVTHAEKYHNIVCNVGQKVWLYLKTIYAPEPGHTLGVNVCGPFGGSTSRENRYMLVITDYPQNGQPHIQWLRLMQLLQPNA